MTDRRTQDMITPVPNDDAADNRELVRPNKDYEARLNRYEGDAAMARSTDYWADMYANDVPRLRRALAAHQRTTLGTFVEGVEAMREAAAKAISAYKDETRAQFDAASSHGRVLLQRPHITIEVCESMIRSLAVQPSQSGETAKGCTYPVCAAAKRGGRHHADECIKICGCTGVFHDGGTMAELFGKVIHTSPASDREGWVLVPFSDFQPMADMLNERMAQYHSSLEPTDFEVAVAAVVQHGPSFAAPKPGTSEGEG